MVPTVKALCLRRSHRLACTGETMNRAFKKSHERFINPCLRPDRQAHIWA